MSTDELPEGAARNKKIAPDALRALEEAAERRRAQKESEESAPREINGPKGVEPTRNGDWERKGIAYDF